MKKFISTISSPEEKYALFLLIKRVFIKASLFLSQIIQKRGNSCASADQDSGSIQRRLKTAFAYLIKDLITHIEFF